MSQKFFPIKTDPACQLKWTWSTINFYSGKTNSCHRVRETPIDLNDFDNFHNTPSKVNDRQLMLAGQWPTGGCEYCSSVEQAGGFSDRQFQLGIPDMYPPELDSDPTAVAVTPRIVEICIDNVCNQSCIYCEDKYSSKIYQENIRFGEFNYGSVRLQNISTRNPDLDLLEHKFWQWMDQHGHHVRRLHILGGEPLFQPQFEHVLSYLETHSNPHLTLVITTNLNIALPRLQTFLDRIKILLKHRRIKKLDFICSIDCWGSEQEYIRHGLDMSRWQQNFEYVLAQKWIGVSINQAITGLGMKSMPELFKYINQHRQHRQIEQYFMVVVNKPYLHPKIFGSGFFDSDFSRILVEMPEDDWHQRTAKQSMQGLQIEWNQHQRDDQELKSLQAFLTEIDRRRGLDWRQVFPWLTKELNYVV
jgi:organic radical activating enzyme